MVYFKPLRRKVGVMTLVVACVFAAGWVRSEFATDEIRVFMWKSTTVHFNSVYSGFEVIGVWVPDTAKLPGNAGLVLMKPSTWGFADRTGWFSHERFQRPFRDSNSKPIAFGCSYSLRDVFPNATWLWKFGRYRLGIDTQGEQGQRAVILTSMYWPIVVPLTLFSAWLLLSKPRATKTEPTEPPV